MRLGPSKSIYSFSSHSQCTGHAGGRYKYLTFLALPFLFPPDSAPDPRVDRYDVMQFSTEHKFMRYLRKPKPTRAEIGLDEKL